jgi:hypothetical protein
MKIEDCDVLDAMVNYGGGFVRELARAWRLADGQNNARLKEAFPHYWEQYREFAEADAHRAARRHEKDSIVDQNPIDANGRAE